MAKPAETQASVLDDREHALRLFRQMALIRRFEERTEEQYTRARIGGYCHLAIGEEASSVGAIDALLEGDALYASYRDHGTALAVGSPAAAVMAELFGKDTGVAHGRGGSMHLLDVERHFYGGWGIVGAHLPIAAGHGPGACVYREQPNAVLCQFGDGAVATGAFHEALNLASLWGLPIVFQAINNQYGMGTSVAQSNAEPELFRRAAAYRVHGEQVDGNDVLAVREAADRLLRQAREERAAGAARDDHVPLPRPLGRRRRARSTARPRRCASWRERDPITRYGLLLGEREIASASRPRRGLGARCRPRSRTRSTGPSRRRSRPARACTTTSTAIPARREQFARMATGAPYGERGDERSWPT